MEKNFGITFTVVFILLGMFPIINGKSPYIYFIIFAVILLSITIFAPKKLSKISKIWLIFGKKLSYLTSPVIMILIYFFSVIPPAIIIKFFRFDLLDIKINKNKKTYWKNSEDFDETLNNQF